MPRAKSYTAQQAAIELRISDAYLRQILIRENGLGNSIGSKFGKQWILTRADLRAIRKLRCFGTRDGHK